MNEPSGQRMAVFNLGFCAQVPIQCIARYPLLLVHLHELKLAEDTRKELIIEVQQMITRHLEIINSARQCDSFDIFGHHIFEPALIQL
jgi:hypothetical protein